MGGSRTPSGCACDALTLRRWMLRAVARGREPFSPDEVAAAARAPLDAWRLCLRVERCAVPLQARLAETGELEQLPPEVGQLLDRLRLGATQRLLSARAHLHRIAALANGAAPVVVLKGGAHLTDGATADLWDVDVLLKPERAPALARALAEKAGFRAVGEDAPVDSRRIVHLAPRVAANAVHVEIHFALRGFPDAEAAIARAVPLESQPALHRLHPEDHLFHLLHHTVVQHPTHRGSIRDLLLVAAAAARCGPDGCAAAVARFTDEATREKAEAVVRAAGALHDGTHAEDPFALIAATAYLCAQGRSRVYSHPLYDEILVNEAALLAEEPARIPHFLRSLAVEAEAPSSSPALRALEARARPVAQTVRGGARLVRGLALLPLCARIARKARRLAASHAGPHPLPS